MARRQQDILDQLIGCFSLRSILVHPATLSLVVTGGLIAGAIFLWNCNHETITHLPEYQLTKEKIELSPVPVWANQDLKDLVLESNQSELTSILDIDLVSRTAKTMQSVGFVDQVRSVDKSKNHLKIDLIYRRPVALVELSKRTLRPQRNAGSQVRGYAMVPVDREGVVMPDVSANELTLPKILIPFPEQHENRIIWSPWQDERILDAAAISDFFVTSAEGIGIAHIVSARHPRIASSNNAPFELWPDRVVRSTVGTIVVWGNAPGKEVDGEATASEKLKALQEFIAAYGPLPDAMRQKIDIRSGIAMPVTETKTASHSENLFSEFK